MTLLRIGGLVVGGGLAAILASGKPVDVVAAEVPPRAVSAPPSPSPAPAPGWPPKPFKGDVKEQVATADVRPAEPQSKAPIVKKVETTAAAGPIEDVPPPVKAPGWPKPTLNTPNQVATADVRPAEPQNKPPIVKVEPKIIQQAEVSGPARPDKPYPVPPGWPRPDWHTPVVANADVRPAEPQSKAPIVKVVEQPKKETIGAAGPILDVPPPVRSGTGKPPNLLSPEKIKDQVANANANVRPDGYPNLNGALKQQPKPK